MPDIGFPKDNERCLKVLQDDYFGMPHAWSSYLSYMFSSCRLHASRRSSFLDLPTNWEFWCLWKAYYGYLEQWYCNVRKIRVKIAMPLPQAIRAIRRFWFPVFYFDPLEFIAWYTHGSITPSPLPSRFGGHEVIPPSLILFVLMH